MYKKQTKLLKSERFILLTATLLGLFGLRFVTGDCTPPTTLINGSFLPNQASYTHGTSVTYTCVTGYALSGSATLTCTVTDTWDVSSPSCFIETCPAEAISHATATPDYSEYNYSTTVTYACDVGYFHDGGDLMRTCSASGVWNGTAPSCSVITCPTEAISHATATPDNSEYNYSTTVTYACDLGYFHDGGDLMRTCSASGVWNGTAPSCSVITCPAEAISHATATPDYSEYNYSTTVTYACDVGYFHDGGDLMRTCSASGVWNGKAPSCSVITCPAEAISHATATPDYSEYNYSTTVTYACDVGYFHDGGDLMRTCSASGVWNGTAPNCSVITCQAEAISHATATPDYSEYNYSTTVTYACDVGYFYDGGDLMRTCSDSGVWNGTAPSCSVITCPTEAISHATATPDYSEYNYSTTVSYACDLGYFHDGGDLMHTCSASGVWNGTAPSCSVETCSSEAISHATATPNYSEYNFSTTVTYACDVGYYHDGGDLIRTCSASGVWNGTAPSCSVITCPTEAISHATATPDYSEYNYSTTVTYACDVGYFYDGGDLMRTCSAGGVWNGTAPSCSVETCSAEAISHATATPDYSEYNFSTTVTFACDVGYNHDGGDLMRTCSASGVWNGTAPICSVKKCAAEAGSNAELNPSASMHNYNTIVTYSCVTGYEYASGDLTRTCQADETWTGDALACTIKTCTPPDDITYGSKSPVQASYNYSTAVTYSCQVGYEMTSGDATRTCQADQSWSGLTPTCTIKQCAQELVTSGTMVPDQAMYDYGTSVAYSCSLAFTHTAGDLVRTCNASALWTGELPTCTVSACLPDPITYGTMNPDTTTYAFSSSVTYTCHPGYYHSSGDDVRTCKTDGSWNGTTPVCSRVTCSPPPDIGNATYLPNLGTDHDYNTDVNYTCDLAYQVQSGDTIRTCQQDFSWSGTDLVCEKYACIQEDSIYTTITPNQTLHPLGGLITYSCNVGSNYSHGDYSRTCQSDGEWNGTLIVCDLVTCQLPLAPAHAQITPIASSIDYNTDMSYTCDTGYNLTSGDATRRCNESSFLNGDEAVCTIVKCDPPPIVSHTTYTPDLTIYNYSMTATYTCDYGYYYASGDTSASCNEFTTWTWPSGNPIVCNIVQCAKPVYQHATVDPDTSMYDFNTTVSSICDLGYNLTGGSAVRLCQGNASWDGSPPNCTLVECELPAAVARASHAPLQTIYQYLDVISYTCEIGYEITIGSPSRQCTENTTWTGDAPTCTIKHCTPPSLGSNQTYTPVLVEHDWNTTVEYTCNIGYNYSTGDLVRRCQDDKTWSGVLPVCPIVTCDKIDVPLMTFSPPTASTHDFNTTIEYSCIVGYNHSYGDLFRTCDHTGQWTGALPNCTIITCDPPAPIANTFYTPVLVEHDWNTDITYECEPNWHYVSGSNTITCNETGYFPPADFDCSAPHYLTADVSEPNVKWLNSTVTSAYIYYDYDYDCSLTVSVDPPLLSVSGAIPSVNRYYAHLVYSAGVTTYSEYTVSVLATRNGRTWPLYNRTAFYGDQIAGISAILNNPINYLAVGDPYTFTISATQGSSVTVSGVMGDGANPTSTHTGLFTSSTISHTYNMLGNYSAVFTLSNLVSDQTDTVDVIVIFKINNLLFSVDSPLTDTTTSSTFQFDVAAVANISMDYVDISIDYKHGTATTDTLDFGTTLTLPATFPYTHLFDVQGVYVVSASAANQVSSESYSITVNVWDSLVPLVFNYTDDLGKYITNTTTIFDFSNTPNSGFEYIIDYGDGNSDASAGDEAIYLVPYSAPTLTHMYTVAGLYTVRWRAWNGWYSRDETFTVLIQNKIPRDSFTLEPIGKLYPWKNLQSMNIPVNITIDDSEPLPTDATCDFDPLDGKAQVPGIVFNNRFLNYDHSYTTEGTFNSTYFCSNEVSNYTFEFNLQVKKYQASSLSVWFLEVVPLNVSATVMVDFYVDSGGYALIPDLVYLDWNWGDSSTSRKRRALIPYDTSIYSHLYTARGNYTVTVNVQADTTSTTNTLTYSLRVGVMYFEYSYTIAFINYTDVEYKMYGFPDPATFTLTFDGKSPDESCSATDYSGCSIIHQCPSYGYMLVTAIASNGSFVEVDNVNVTCDNPIPEDMVFSFPSTIAIPDGWIQYDFIIKPTDLFIPHLTCKINFGDPIFRKDRIETQEVTYASPFTGQFQYLALGVHPINVECWNLINTTTYSQSIIVTNKDFLFTGTFDRRFSQPELPLLISSFHDTAIFSRLIILANHTVKTHFNVWSINASLTPIDRHDLLFARGDIPESLYYITLKVCFIEEPTNCIFEPTWVQLVMPPPHVEIVGGRRRLVTRKNVTVDASTLSYDPARPNSGSLTFSWACRSYDASSFEDAIVQHAAFNPTPVGCTVTTSSTPGIVFLNTNANPLRQYYVMEATVSNSRGMSAMETQILKIDIYEELSILCKINCLAKTAVTSDKQLVPNLDHNCPNSFVWELHMQSGGSYSSIVDLSTITKTGYTNQSLTISANSLLPGRWYLVTLSAVINGVSKVAYYEFVTNRAPAGGSCKVIPHDITMLPLNKTLPVHPANYSGMDEYYAASSLFNLTCQDWTDEGYSDSTFTTNEPLFYFYFLAYNRSAEDQRQILYFDPGSTSNLVTFHIGDPDFADQPYIATVVLRVVDVFGDYAETKFDVISKPGLKTEDLAPLSDEDKVEALRVFIDSFEPNMTKAATTYDYRTLARQSMDIASVYNLLELNTSSSVTLTPEDLLSLGYKENNDGERISWSDYWRLIVEVVDTSTTDVLVLAAEKYTTMLYNAITTWPDNKEITIVAIETMSRALVSLMNRTENTNITASKLAAECANIMCYNLASRAAEKPFPNTESLWAAATAIRSLIRNIVLSLQTVLTPNLPEDPTVDEMRQHLEYIQIFKTTDEVASEPLSIQEQTFLAQKQLQKYYLAKHIKSEASKIAMPNITEALRNLTVMFQRMTSIGQQEIVLEDDIIYVSTEIAPKYEIEGFSVIRPMTAMEVTKLTETAPKDCNSSTVFIRTIIFKANPYFWGTFADRISSYVPVFEIDGATIDDPSVTFRLGNKVVPECIDETPTYDEDDPNKMIYILFDRMHADDDILLFIRPNATDLVYQLYFNPEEKPVIEENKYIYSTEIKTDKWTKEDGYKLMIESTKIAATGKIWIALRPLLEKSTDLSLLQLPFCANVTSVNCLAWRQDAEGEFFWDKTMCEVSPTSSRAETVCICQNPGDGSPMTVGTTFYVPPSKVDFKNLEDVSNEYGRGPVFGMIIASMVAYFLLLFWAWREDIKDQYKWSYALLIDNDIADSYFYIMKVYTGLRASAGTNSKVGFILMGEFGHTGERIMDDESHVGFERGTVRTFVMSTRRRLGELQNLRVWHDDSGSGLSASWFLAKVTVDDLQHNKKYVFRCGKWLTYDFEDKVVVRALVAEPIENAKSFKSMVSYTVANSHVWVSLFLRPMRSNFSRTQRLASLMGLIYITMIICVMILKTPDEYVMQQIVIGPFRFSLENLWTSLIAVSISSFIILLVTFFFRNAEAPDNPNDVYSLTRRMYRNINDRLKIDKSVLATTYEPPAESTVAYDYHFLPHFCVYIGWTILAMAVLMATYLLVMFSGDWPLVKSEEWMTAIFMACILSILLVEPVKILVVLLFYSVFCPRAYEPPDPYVDIARLIEITKQHSATFIYGPQFENVLKPPINPDKETLIQNKINRIRDHQLLRIFSQLLFFSAVLYLVYTISFQSRDPLSFYLKNHIVESYDFQGEVQNTDTYIRWLNGTFINTYFSHTYFGAPTTDTNLKGYGEDLANVRVGPARLRQLRVLPEPCQGPLGVNETCRNKFREDMSDTIDYCVQWQPWPCDVSQKSKYFTSAAWIYKTAEEVWGFPTIAEYATYGGGGFFMKLDVNMEVSQNIFNELVTLNWMDKRTRVVIVEFTVYNGNANLFCYAKFVAEFPEVGGVVTFLDVQVFRLYTHNGPEGNYILFLEFIFLLCVIAATLIIFQELATDVKSFVTSVWNMLDFLALIMSYSTISCYIYKLIIAQKTIDIFHEDKNAYVGFENIAFYDFITNTTLAVLVFLLSLRVSRILGYSGKINEMAAVISQSADDLLAFLVIFGITYFAYVAYGTLLFGKDTAKYRDMFQTYGTLTEAVVGKNRLENILSNKPGYAEFYYFTFVLFVLMTLVTMAAAILNFSISNVKQETEKMAPTNIVEVIIDRLVGIFHRLGNLGNKNSKPSNENSGDSESDINEILSDLRLFLRNTMDNSKKSEPGDKYRADSPESTSAKKSLLK